MLKNSILPTGVNTRKIVKKLILLNIITYICIGLILPLNTFAAQKKYSYSQGSLNSYSGYEDLIKNLQQKHPTWTFTILNTGLDWNEVIKNETVASHGRNLIYYTNSGGWVCSTCGDTTYDSGKWKCASETAVAYYMDPRNWINEENIFQFENLAFNKEVQNIDGVKKILASVPWANAEKITYTKTDGTTATLEKSYAQVIMEAAEESGVSPYHLAARLKQEQGANTKASSTGSGTYTGYVGYYNFFNIKATGSNIIGNALKHAQSQGWDDPEKSIKGGAVFIASEYINRGQSTLYLQKFDVDNSDGAMYYHQYMQNVSAAVTEGNTVKSSYEGMGMLNSSLNFVIPVYNNMPEETCPSPSDIYVVTQNVKVTGNSVAVRDGKSTTANEIAKVNTGDILLRIELSGKQENGYYWDKVVLPDGTKGYIARSFIEQISDVTNSEISAIANVNVNLRNGPGTTGTRVLKTLTSGQSVTIIETGKYNGVDGYNWSRVKLNNGTQGYLVSDYLTEVTETNYIIAYINCNADGKVNMRNGIGTSNSVVTSLRKDTKVTVLEKAAGTANGYIWDKIVTADGLEGYIANTYLRYEGDTSVNDGEVVTNSNNNSFKIEGSSVVVEPNTKVSDIKTKYTNATIVKADGTVLGDGDLIGTGCVISVGEARYTVVKMGDVNGDGLVKATDYMKIKNNIMGISVLDELYKKAADVNNDGQIKATDYMKIKNSIMGISKIGVN